MMRITDLRVKALGVIPWLDHGIHKNNLNYRLFKYFSLDAVVKPRHDKNKIKNMFIDKIKAKANNDKINVIIEIPMNSGPIKYEFDKESGAVFVDRFMQTTMSYPCNYGFIPHTLSNDADPVDVLVVAHHPVVPGSVIKCRAVGVLMMEDESGLDEKIIAVPTSKLDITFDHIKELDDLCEMLKKRIVHFFEHYKDLEKGKWVKVTGWKNKAKADSLINEGIDRVGKA